MLNGSKTEVVKEEDEAEEEPIFTTVSNVKLSNKPSMISQQTQTATEQQLLKAMPQTLLNGNERNQLQNRGAKPNLRIITRQPSAQDELDIYSSVKDGKVGDLNTDSNHLY